LTQCHITQVGSEAALAMERLPHQSVFSRRRSNSGIALPSPTTPVMKRQVSPGSPRRNELKQALLNQASDRELPPEMPTSAPRKGIWHFILGEDPGNGIAYGIVNFIVCVPALVSYTHIVFPSSRFGKVMPLLVKLFFFSSGVHQVMFLALSTLPFAVGQIQDVGLIFLAGMVRNLVRWAEDDQWTEEELIATALWQCATSTCMVGICIVLVGKLKLGTYVQMLPLPVVAGYLAYIGYFCLVAGLASVTVLDLSDPLSLLQLLDPKLGWKLGLLVLMTSVLLVARFKVDTIWGIPTMPFVLAMQPAIFFAALWWFNISPNDCRKTGWLPPPVPASHGPAIFSYFDPSKVKWDSMVSQWSNFVGLVIVVFFGSALDVAAIQAEMGSKQLDFDGELNTIGWGNIVSGLTGGATGSYIFSQTIFSAKVGVRSRLNGIIVAVGEIVLFFADIDLLRVLPNAYIGAIMCLFGIDIMLDWMVHSYP